MPKNKLKKIISNQDLRLVIYKLLHDVLFLTLISFTLIMVAEGLIPGFFSNHIGLTKLSLVLPLVAGAIILVGKDLDITPKETALAKSKLLPVLILAAFLLIGNSMLRFELWENFAITLATLFVFFLFYKIISSPEEKN